MEYEELKQRSTYKVLLKAESGKGKTMNSCRIAMLVAEAGGKVLYADTESEAATTIVEMVERGDFEEGVVRNIEHVLVDGPDEFLDLIEDEVQSEYDLVVYDTLDNKHNYAIREVTDAKKKADADWNEYPVIYDYEKTIMEEIGKPECCVVATIDPESGKHDKPKGCQTNIEGFFSAVLKLTTQRSEGGQVFGAIIENYVGDFEGKKIGKQATGDNLEKVVDSIADKVIERTGV